MKNLGEVLSAMQRPPGCSLPTEGYDLAIGVDRAGVQLYVSHDAVGYVGEFRSEAFKQPDSPTLWRSHVEVGLSGTKYLHRSRRDGSAWETIRMVETVN